MALVGLPAAGKSSFVAALHGKESEQIAPTAGCNKSSLHREDLILDLLDVGGSPQVRKFWTQLVGEVDALIVMVNSTDVNETSWTVLAEELRRLRADRPVLLLLNAHDEPLDSCLPECEVLERLGIVPNPEVRVVAMARSSDIVSADLGLSWLCSVLVRELPTSDATQEATLWAAAAAALDDPHEASTRTHAAGGAALLDADRSAAAPGGVRSRTRLRVMQAVEDARQYDTPETELANALAAKLASGHLLSSEELSQLRRDVASDFGRRT